MRYAGNICKEKSPPPEKHIAGGPTEMMVISAHFKVMFASKWSTWQPNNLNFNLELLGGSISSLE